MTNIEKKYKLWGELSKDFSHLNCDISVDWCDDDDIYFHPKFVIDEHFSLIGQCDIENGFGIYGIEIHVDSDRVATVFQGAGFGDIMRIFENIDGLRERFIWIANAFRGGDEYGAANNEMEV